MSSEIEERFRKKYFSNSLNNIEVSLLFRKVVLLLAIGWFN